MEKSLANGETGRNMKMRVSKDLTYIFWPGRGGLVHLHWLRCLAGQPGQTQEIINNMTEDNFTDVSPLVT